MIKRILLGLILALVAYSANAQFINRITSPGVLDAGGAMKVDWAGEIPTYFASLGNNTPAATPTDVAILTGSSTKTVRVQRVRITVASTAAAVIEYRLVMRSGGTQSAVNTAFANGTHSGPMDSNDPASSVIAAGIAGVYTGNPASTGTVVGIISDWTIVSSTAGAVIFEYKCDTPSKCPVLRGTTQILAVNGNGHTLATGEKFGVEFHWTEE